jgi:Thiamine monophosphate synthase
MTKPANSWTAQVRLLVAACWEAGALSFVNDRVDVALAADADGAHVGQVCCIIQGVGFQGAGLQAADDALVVCAPDAL